MLTAEKGHIHVVDVDGKEFWIRCRARLQPFEVALHCLGDFVVFLLRSPPGMKVHVRLKGAGAFKLVLAEEGGEGLKGRRAGGHDKGLEFSVAEGDEERREEISKGRPTMTCLRGLFASKGRGRKTR